jgi:hypothetical protein
MQPSFSVHALPSSQPRLLSFWQFPLFVLHDWHWGQTVAVPPPQIPLVHFSPVVQALPSLHAVLSATLVFTQLPETHASVVHGFWSLHWFAFWHGGSTHNPLMQVLQSIGTKMLSGAIGQGNGQSVSILHGICSQQPFSQVLSIMQSSFVLQGRSQAGVAQQPLMQSCSARQ